MRREITTGTYHRSVALPENVWRTIEIGVARLDPTRVFLYGSRARGTHRRGSDWDIAFEGVFDLTVWTRYRAEMFDEGPTFLPIDLVPLKTASAEFRANILRDGRLLYSR